MMNDGSINKDGIMRQVLSLTPILIGHTTEGGGLRINCRIFIQYYRELKHDCVPMGNPRQ